MSNASLDVLAVAQRLQQQDEPCALVTVLRVQAPASARPGDKAVVSADGIVAGWIGGGDAKLFAAAALWRLPIRPSSAPASHRRRLLASTSPVCSPRSVQIAHPPLG